MNHVVYLCCLSVSAHLWDIPTGFWGWQLKGRGRDLCTSVVMQSLWCSLSSVNDAKIKEGIQYLEGKDSM